MKACITFFLLFTCIVSFGQSEKYLIDLHIEGGYELMKRVIRDYGATQLMCGTANDNGTKVFWFARVTDGTPDWVKSTPAHPNWAEMDISPTDIVQCGENGDVLFIGRGNDDFNNYSAVLIKVNAAGSLLWSRKIFAEPATYSQTVYENNPVIAEDDGVIVSMSGRNHLQVTKLDWNGNMIYSKQLRIDGPMNMLKPGHLFIPNSSGGYFAGFEWGDDPAVISLDESLNVLWSRRITQIESSQLRSICQTGSGGLLIGGISGTGTFLAKLNETGNIQNYRIFGNSALYSIDQLFELSDTTILANGRTGYLLIDPEDWSCDERQYISSPFSSFRKTGDNDWSFGSEWSLTYYLDFNPLAPECFAYEGPIHTVSTAVSATDETITCTITDLGTLQTISSPLTDIPATLYNDCFLSVSEEMPNDFVISPNPMGSGEVISFSDVADDQEGYVVFKDVQGNSVAEMPFESQIMVPELSSGIYFIAITERNGRVCTRKMIVE